MARYLVVAHETATSPLLLSRVGEIAAEDRQAQFTILVPEAHASGSLICNEVETREAARQRAAEAKARFCEAGFTVRDVRTGASSPVHAISDELRLHPREHDAIVLSTLPPGRSRWLKLEVPWRVKHSFALPLFHVMDDADHLWSSTAEQRQMVARGDRDQGLYRREPPPRRGDDGGMRSWWYNLAWWPAGGLLLLHAMVMSGLAAAFDPRFLGGEALVLGFFTVTILLLRRSE